MKVKINIKDKLLAKHPNLICREENGEFIIVLKVRSGEFIAGRGKDPEGAWKSCASFYGGT